MCKLLCGAGKENAPGKRGILCVCHMTGDSAVSFACGGRRGLCGRVLLSVCCCGRGFRLCRGFRLGGGFRVSVRACGRGVHLPDDFGERVLGELLVKALELSVRKLVMMDCHGVSPLCRRIYPRAVVLGTQARLARRGVWCAGVLGAQGVSCGRDVLSCEVTSCCGRRRRAGS